LEHAFAASGDVNITAEKPNAIALNLELALSITLIAIL
jgi:hypothetical protein